MQQAHAEGVQVCRQYCSYRATSSRKKKVVKQERSPTPEDQYTTGHLGIKCPLV